MSCGPEQEFIFPDPVLLQVVTATSEAGACVPSASPDAGNCGALQPLVRGVPSDADSQLPAVLEIVESGDSSAAGYTVKLADQLYQQGMNDPIINTKYSSPFRETGSDADVRVSGTSTVFSEPFQRLLIVGAPRNVSDAYIRIKYQDAVGDPYSWTTVTFNPEDLGAPARQVGPSQINGPAIVDAENGNLLLFYTYQEEVSAVGDENQSIAVLKSIDGGLTWVLLHRKINRTFVDRNRSIRVARSGSWIRVAWLDDANAVIAWSVSRDNGLTWSHPIQSTLTLPTLNASEDGSPWDIVGLGNGVFLLVKSTTATQWLYHKAFQDGLFTLVFQQLADRERTALGTIYSLCAVTAFGRVWVFLQTTDFGGSNNEDQISVYYQDVELALGVGPGVVTGEPGEWQPIEPLTEQQGTRTFGQWLSAASVCGRELFVFGSAYDEVSVGTVAGSISFRLAGISPKPLGQDAMANFRGMAFPPLGEQRTGSSGYQHQWCSPFQLPAGPGGSSPDTSWTRLLTGLPTIDYTKERLNLGCSAAQGIEYLLSSFATGATSWLSDGAVIGAKCRITAGGNIGTESAALKFQTRESALGTNEIRVQIRLSMGLIIVYDQVAAVTRFTLPIDCTDWIEVRAALHESGSNRRVRVTAYRVDDPANTLVENEGSFTSAAVVTGNDELQYGHTAIGTAADSGWKEVYVLRNPTAAERDYRSAVAPVASDPFVYLGIPASETVCIGGGMTVVWGGASSAIGDSYTLGACWLYPASNIFTDSPTIGWRSGGADPLLLQELILQVDGSSTFTRGMFNRFVLMGIEEPDIEVTMANDLAFSVDVAGPETMDTRIFTALEVQSVDGDTLRHEVTAPGMRLPFDGEVIDLRIVFTSGALIGETFSADMHDNGVTRVRRKGSNNIEGLGLLAMDTFDVFLPFGVLSFSGAAPRRRKFLRFRFPALQTATGDHRLGALMAGIGVPVPVPLEWTHGDAEEADVTLFEGRGAVSWGYAQGPPRRIWTGRVINDYLRWRDTMRHLLRKASQYGVHPIAILPDTENQRSLIYGRWNGGSNLENSFWWEQDDGDGPYRFPGGDLQIPIVEVP